MDLQGWALVLVVPGLARFVNGGVENSCVSDITGRSAIIAAESVDDDGHQFYDQKAFMYEYKVSRR